MGTRGLAAKNLFQARRPLVFAHRGASADAPENTLAAFALAREQGADGIELDVMCAASGEVIVFHDDDLCRYDGHGICRARKQHTMVRALDYQTLKQIDVGRGERIPLLSEVFEQLRDLLINVELKSAPTWKGRYHDGDVAERVAALITRHGLIERVLVSSFDPTLLWRFSRLQPLVRTALLLAKDSALPLRRGWAMPLLQPFAVHPELSLVTPRVLTHFRERGLAVNVWTVDAAADITRLTTLGVSGIITNRPGFARAVLSSKT